MVTNWKIDRVRAGMLAKDAARELGIHPITLGRIENGVSKKFTHELALRMQALYAERIAAQVPE